MSALFGKTALVTGASRGIGRSSALALAKAGANVLVHYGNSEKEADAAVAEIRKAGGHAEKVGADLRQADGPHILANRSALFSATGSTSWSLTPASRRRRASRTPRSSRTSTISSP
jgi:NAD(P)-dependent dehydrogenase (short-subunit alcohol dehydrogenase family)